MSALTAIGAAALIFGFVVFAYAVIVINRWREWHHVYIGIAIGGLGLWLSTFPSLWVHTLSAVVLILGTWIEWDDAAAHLDQSSDPEYKRQAALFYPGPYGPLDDKYSWWHRTAHRLRAI